MKKTLLSPTISIIFLSTLMISIGFGSANLSANAEVGEILYEDPNWYFNGNAAGTKMGSAVSGVGDVNGDGKPDVLVGAELYQGTQSKEGAAFLFLGSGGSLSNVPDWQFFGGQQGSYLGCNLTGLGDINQDGVDDIAISACEYNIEENDEVKKSKVGAVYVFHGSEYSILSTQPDWSFFGDQVEAYLGSSVSSAGDINNDGYMDMLVGAPSYPLLDELGNPVPNEKRGKVFLFLGSKDGFSSTSDWQAEGKTNGEKFGFSLTTADVDGDGDPDVIIGAPRPTNKGSIYVYENVGGALSSLPKIIVHDQSGSQFGFAVRGVGYVNDDIYEDVVIGAPDYKEVIDLNLVSKGCVYLFAGSSTGLSGTPSREICGQVQNGRLGASLAKAGDMDNDGFDDFLVGSPDFSEIVVEPGEEQQGAVFLFFGASKTSSPAHVRADVDSIFGGKADTDFGISVSSIGDINGDNQLDIIIGAPDFKVGGIRPGRAMAYFAGIPGIPEPDYTFSIFLPVIQK